MGAYNMSGDTGSLRYMAPEVAKNLPYNQKVDVYAFGEYIIEFIYLICDNLSSLTQSCFALRPDSLADVYPEITI